MKSYDNTILTNEARKDYQEFIDVMKKLVPDMMNRKISEANVQQAFVFDRVHDLYEEGDSILSVGCFEDTAYAALVEWGYEIDGIDPDVDGNTLESFFNSTDKKYNIIFSTSVIEHVQNDEQFIDMICKLLKSGGYAVLTTDFRDDYTPTMPLPYTDLRFYTKKDLEVRLLKIIEENGCRLINQPSWEGKPDFHYQGHDYSFATLVFRKIDV